MIMPNRRFKTVVQQMISIKAKYRTFKVLLGRNCLVATGSLQPTSRSQQYIAEIRYNHLEFPEIRILSPTLVTNFKGDKIPHVYPGKRLCLFYPKYSEFKFADLLSETIIPWTSLWLYYYEVWHMTGEWLGGGIHNEN